MKKIIFVISIIYTHFCTAQMPHAFKYQGLARGHNLEVLADSPVSLMASIIAGRPDGHTVYREVHQVLTTATGLFSAPIGQGAVLQGSIFEILWSDGIFYLKVEIDLNGSGHYEYAGTSPLLAVPYAMHAYTAEIVDDADADPANELQHLEYDASRNQLKISGGNIISLPFSANDPDEDATNELQELAFDAASNSLSISGGNSVSLPVAVADADSDPANELQTLSFNPATKRLRISDGNEVELPADGDTDPSNEIQELSVFKQFKPLAPLKLRLSKGNAIDLPVTSVWEYSSKNDNLSQIYTTIPVTSKSFTAELLEVTPRPAHWDHPQITPTEYQFRTAQGTTGMRMSKNRLAYHYASNASKYKMFLDERSLRYYNTSEWITSEIGGDQSGLLKLYPGSSSTPFFVVEKTGNKSKLSLASIASKNQIFSLLENGNSAVAVWYGQGSSSVIINGSGSKPGHGAVSVADAKSATQAGMYVDAQGKGVLFADIKNFVVDHPKDAEKEIVYASIEGPEAAIYERGTAELIDGEATIEFSEHFTLMLAEKGLTVTLTPLSADSKGLAVIEKDNRGIKVKELYQNKGTYSFDWEVKGVRKGYEDFEVIRIKQN